MVLKDITNVANNNPFSVYSNYFEISSKYNGDLDECNISNTTCTKWFEAISEELQSNVTVVQNIIDVRDGGKACESLGMDDVQFITDDICIN